MRSLFQLALAIAITSVASPALAQPVAAEFLSRDPSFEGLQGALAGSFSVARGNVNVLDIGGGIGGQYQTLFEEGDEERRDGLRFVRHAVIAKANARFAERPEDVFVSQAFAHLRWRGMWHRRIGSEIFVQAQFNEFLRLSLRALGGVGARFEIVHRSDSQLTLGIAYMAELEQLIDANDSEGDRINHRSTNYLAVRFDLFEGRLLVQNIVYFQPRLDDAKDFRLLESFELSAPVTEWLSIGTKFTLLHDNDPPEGVATTDLRFVTTLKLSFES